MKFNYFLFLILLILLTNNCSDRLEKTNDVGNNTQISKQRILLDSAYELINTKNSTLFKKVNEEGLNAALAAKDTFDIADAHWNYGYFYLEKQAFDSSYYHYNLAHRNFIAINEHYTAARMLFNMAVVQNNLKDYTGSEITTFRAIEIFDPKRHQINLYRCYNNLGMLYYNLGEFTKSIESHTKAQEFLKGVKNKRTFFEGSLNNIGLVFQKQNDYSQAIVYFKKALSSDSLFYKNRKLYIRLLDNLAYNKFLSGDTTNVYNELLKPLRLRDSMNNTSGIALSKLHLSEYFAYKQDTAQAISYAADARKLAKRVDNHRDQLVALQLLASYDTENAGNYLATYVQLNDSLQAEERRIRNKFTRIRFETDEYIEQAEQLSNEKQLILIIGIGAVFLLGALIFIIRQRSKTRQLRLENEQQQDREQIYNLMLEQQSKLAEGKAQERIRISEKLHDGVLGSMYGTRMGLGFLDIEGSKETQAKYEELLEQMLRTEKEVRDISHALQDDIFTEEHDFVSIIDAYLERINLNDSLNVRIEKGSEIPWSTIDNDVKTHIFRIIQEAFYNTYKYANATLFKVHFSTQGNTLNLVIEDDGKGFNLKKNAKGIGLKNMSNRIESLGGEIAITSEINKGTKINITLLR